MVLADWENSSEMTVAWHRIHLTATKEFQRNDVVSRSGRTGHRVEEEVDEDEERGRCAEEQSRSKVSKE